MPKDQLNRITIQNKKLDDIIKECGGNYEGTDPIQDRKRIYEAAASKALKIKKIKGSHPHKYEFKSQQEIKDEQEEYHAFDKFGPGIKSYFQLQKMIMFCMLMFTVLFTPVIVIYKSGNFYDEQTMNYKTV